MLLYASLDDLRDPLMMKNDVSNLGTILDPGSDIAKRNEIFTMCTNPKVLRTPKLFETYFIFTNVGDFVHFLYSLG